MQGCKGEANCAGADDGDMVTVQLHVISLMVWAFVMRSKICQLR